MIIHICGASGAGKTTLGNKLKAHFGRKILIFDIDDDLRDKVISKYEKTTMRGPVFVKRYTELFQKFVDDLIAKYNKLLIIFVGLSTFINGEEIRFRDKYYPKVDWILDLRADHKFYIDIAIAELIKQKYYREYDDFIARFCEYMKREKDTIYKQAVSNQKQAKEDLSSYITECISFDRTTSDAKNWDAFYKKSGYVSMTRDALYASTVSLLKAL